MSGRQNLQLPLVHQTGANETNRRRDIARLEQLAASWLLNPVLRVSADPKQALSDEAAGSLEHFLR